MKILWIMGIVRDDISTPWGKCIDCGCGTRSHELEPAEYEIFTTEAIVAGSDVYASKEWEDVEDVEKFERVLDAIVMCHKCWSAKQTVFVSFVRKHFENWRDNALDHAADIKHAVNTQVYYDYDDAQTIDALKILAKKLKEASLNG